MFSSRIDVGESQYIMCDPNDLIFMIPHDAMCVLFTVKHLQAYWTRRAHVYKDIMQIKRCNDPRLFAMQLLLHLVASEPISIAKCAFLS